MEKMNFGRGTGNNADGTYSVSDVAYLTMLYMGSYNLSAWEEVSTALRLSDNIKVATEDISKAFECLDLLEHRMCMATIDKKYGNPTAFMEIMGDICRRFTAACSIFGVSPKELIKFWNTKLDILHGGHLRTEAENML